MKRDTLQFSECGKAIDAINEIADGLDIHIDYNELYNAVIAQVNNANQVTFELVETTLNTL